MGITARLLGVGAAALLDACASQAALGEWQVESASVANDVERAPTRPRPHAQDSPQHANGPAPEETGVQAGPCAPFLPFLTAMHGTSGTDPWETAQRTGAAGYSAQVLEQCADEFDESHRSVGAPTPR